MNGQGRSAREHGDLKADQEFATGSGQSSQDRGNGMCNGPEAGISSANKAGKYSDEEQEEGARAC